MCRCEERLPVDDYCHGIQLIGEKDRDGGIYNIGGGAELTNWYRTRRLAATGGSR